MRRAFIEQEDYPYVPRSGPAVSPSNLRPSYAESPYSHEIPPEQKSIQEAIEKGADEYEYKRADVSTQTKGSVHSVHHCILVDLFSFIKQCVSNYTLV